MQGTNCNPVNYYKGVCTGRGGGGESEPVQILLLSCSFREKIDSIIDLHPHLGSWCPRQGNPGSATENVTLDPKGRPLSSSPLVRNPVLVPGNLLETETRSIPFDCWNVPEEE